MLRPRESIATLMLGTASVSLAIVMLLVTILGLRGRAFAPWSEPRELLVEAVPRGYEVVPDPQSHELVTLVKLVPAGRVWVPSSEAAALAMLSWALAGLGLVVAWRRRHFSWLSAIGLVLSLVTMANVVASGTLLLNLRR
jgi:hypothetical protein